MGYTGILGNYRHESMKEAFEKVVVNSDYKSMVLDYSVRGNTAYMAIEYIDKDSKEVKRTIVVFLLRKSATEFMYKDMDESMGPYYYDCPLKLMKLVEGYDPINNNALEWRKAVYEYHASKKAEKQKQKNAESIIILGRKARIIEDRTIDSIVYSLIKISRMKAGYIIISKATKRVVSKNRYFTVEQAWNSL